MPSPKGEGPTVIDLLGGQVQVAFLTPSSSLAHIKEGKLRPLAVLPGKLAAAGW